METHVLVPHDGSPQAWAAFDHAIANGEAERLTVLHVVNPAEGVYTDYGGGGYVDQQARDRALERGSELGDQARERAAEAGTPETTSIETAVEIGSPPRTIIDYADEHDVDHIVMGSHGRTGVARILLGSVAETVTRRAGIPVTIVR